MTETDRWFEDYQSICDFAMHLHSEGRFNTPSDVLYYFEKPWKWDPEFQEWRNTSSEPDFEAITQARLEDRKPAHADHPYYDGT